MAFADWVIFNGMVMPVSGMVAAAYLLELAADNAPLEAVRLAADAIRQYYAQHHAYIDDEAIRAAIALAEAQLAPGRLLQ
jgi:hypothetical protein